MLPKDLREKKELSEWAVLLAYRGSITHGLYVPQNKPESIDDKDVMSIIIPPIEYYFGLKEFGSRGTKEIKQNEWDIVIYELKKFISLLAKGNPNVLSMLWLEETHYIKRTDEGCKLIENRDLFKSKQVYHSFTGYAYGQLHRMTHFKFEGYMGAKRKSLVEKFGLDVKNACHLIRLLRMGIEFLIEGELYVQRKDAQQLLEIKRGEWSLEQIKAEADKLFKKAEDLYSISTLPNHPDYDKIDDLCINIFANYFSKIDERHLFYD